MNSITHEWISKVSRLSAEWRGGTLKAAEFAALYFLIWQIAVHGNQFASRKCKGDIKPDSGQCLNDCDLAAGETRKIRLLYWLNRFQFRGVSSTVPVALVRWLQGSWPLMLCDHVPTPDTMLHLQVIGRRAVTVITEYPRMVEPINHKHNAYAFFLHDLEHAYKFFHSPALHAGQRAYFAKLQNALSQGRFAPYLSDPIFIEQLHYLMSDMNTHPQHSQQYLRAILVLFHQRREQRKGRDTLSAEAECLIADLMQTMNGHATKRVA